MDANSLAFLRSDFIKPFYSPEYYGRRDEMPLEFRNKFCYFLQ